MIKAIVFDFDGVILDSADIKTVAFRKLFFDFPEQIDAIIKYHTDNMGISRYDKFRYIYKNILMLPLTEEEERNLGKRFSDIVLKEILEAPFVRGAIEFLQDSDRSTSFFVASGTPHDELDFITKKREVNQWFTEVHGTPKGKVDIILDIMERYGYKKNEVVFVGDAESDRKAAVKTGIHFVARIADSGQNLSDCQYKISDLFELSRVVDTIARGKE